MEKCPSLKNLLAYWKGFSLVCCNFFHPGNPLEKINATCPFTHQAVPDCLLCPHSLKVSASILRGIPLKNMLWHCFPQV